MARQKYQRKKCDYCRDLNHKKLCVRDNGPYDAESPDSRCKSCKQHNLACGPDLAANESAKTRSGRKRRRETAGASTRSSSPEPSSRRNAQGLRSGVASGQAPFEGPPSSGHIDAVSQSGSPAAEYAREAGVPSSVPGPTPALRDSHTLPVPRSTIQVLEAVPPAVHLCYTVLDFYHYMKHIDASVLRETDSSTGSKVQERVARFLEDKIKELLIHVVEGAHESEHPLLLATEILKHLQKITGDEKKLDHVFLECLQRRIEIASRHTLSATGDLPTSQAKSSYLRIKRLQWELAEFLSNRDAQSDSSSPATSSRDGEWDSSAMQDLPTFSKILQGISDILTAFPKMSNRRRWRRSKTPRLLEALACCMKGEARLILNAGQYDVRELDVFGRNGAHALAQADALDLRTLIPSFYNLLEAKDSFGLTPMMIAIIHSETGSCIQLFEEKVAQLNHDYAWLSERDYSGRNFLSIAALHGKYEIVDYLLTRLGFQPNRNGDIYPSAIECGIESGSLPICRLLVSRGADLLIHNMRPWKLAQRISPRCSIPLLKYIEDETQNQDFLSQAELPYLSFSNPSVGSFNHTSSGNPWNNSDLLNNQGVHPGPPRSSASQQLNPTQDSEVSVTAATITANAIWEMPPPTAATWDIL